LLHLIVVAVIWRVRAARSGNVLIIAQHVTSAAALFWLADLRALD